MIYGEGIRFRSPERADLKHFVVWLNDPEVRESLAVSLPMSMAREEQWFQDTLKRPAEQQPFAIEIRKGKAWKLIGTCAFHDINWQERSAEVGIMIGVKEEWNKGYGTAAMNLLVRHGFDTLNLHRLYLHVYADNARGIRAYEKTGFAHEGRLRDARFDNGKYSDVLLMSILQPEWQTRRTESPNQKPRSSK